MKMFYIQTTRFMFLTALRHGIIFKKKYFLQNYSISIEEVKKKTNPQNYKTKQKPLDRKEKLCDISDCTNFTFPVVTESNKEFLV